ncbi:MAG: class I SAM-dependent methyltransferase, partial [Anaerolineae bacterium]|nr:class I SAM-dependent methyltransferase [Anaerolineae bacterium]
LAYEMDFIRCQLAAIGAHRVLDAACGTGWHAIALAQAGYAVTGADLSVNMLERARRNAAEMAVHPVHFVVAGFGQLRQAVEGLYDALLCLGNSLPHVLTDAQLHTTLADFGALLRPGGLLLIQNRNFDAVMHTRNRWMTPQWYRQGDQEQLFVRFYDFNADNTLTFNVLILERTGDGAWTQRAEATLLRPWRSDELCDALAINGFANCTLYGDMTGSQFEATTSGDLVITAYRRG